jgi:hypothetical protein
MDPLEIPVDYQDFIETEQGLFKDNHRTGSRLISTNINQIIDLHLQPIWSLQEYRDSSLGALEESQWRPDVPAHPVI